MAPDIDLVTQLAFASAELVREKAPKVVSSAETIDVASQIPAPGGLFDYRVFGPGTVIDAPALVDDEPHKPRKTQFARIALAMPLVHPLVCENAPDKALELAGLHDRNRECERLLDDDQLYTDLIGGLELGGYGPVVMRELPVLPPDLRPLRRQDDDHWAVSPLNDLYRRVISRNGRLAHVVETNAPSVILAGERRQLHEAMHELFAGELIASFGGIDGFTAALRELDQHPAGQQLTGKLYRTESVLFALAIIRESSSNDAHREAAA